MSWRLEWTCWAIGSAPWAILIGWLVDPSPEYMEALKYVGGAMQFLYLGIFVGAIHNERELNKLRIKLKIFGGDEVYERKFQQKADAALNKAYAAILTTGKPSRAVQHTSSSAIIP